MATFKKNQAVTVNGTKAHPDRRPGKFVAEHDSKTGTFIEVMLDGSTATARFRASQVRAA